MDIEAIKADLFDWIVTSNLTADEVQLFFEAGKQAVSLIRGGQVGEKAEAEIAILRKCLWLNHGCPVHKLYGDDGNMQCPMCRIDFKNSSISDLMAGLKRRDEMFTP